jgi:hypothetical protein
VVAAPGDDAVVDECGASVAGELPSTLVPPEGEFVSVPVDRRADE